MPTLIVQQGHCNRRTGATGTTGEQDYARQVAAAAVRLLDGRGGWRIRPTLADENDYRADAFVAIHCDGSVHATARGASAGYRTPEGQQFAQAWQHAYAARGWPLFRPDNYTAALSGYYGVRNAVSAGTRRAFIAECGFLTNTQDRELLTRPFGPERVVLALGDALGIPHGWDEAEDDDQEDDDMGMVRLMKGDKAPDVYVVELGTQLIDSEGEPTAVRRTHVEGSVWEAVRRMTDVITVPQASFDSIPKAPGSR